MNLLPIFLGIGYLVMLVVGIYIGQNTPYTSPVKYYTKSVLQNTTETVVDVNVSFAFIGAKYKTDKVTFHHYDTMYEKYMRKYIGTNVSLLEIGLGCGMGYGPGASAYLWREYLGEKAHIYFLEFNKQCGEAWLATHGPKLNITMFYGSQDDEAVLNNVNSSQGYFDVIVDDGGHSMKQQITSLVHLFPKVRPGGVYVIEDLQTSYFHGADSGYLVKTTTIEFIKQLIDDVQVDSPKKLTQIGPTMFSFEIGNKICFFNKK